MTFVHRTRRLALGAGLLLAAMGLVAPALAATVGVGIVDKMFEPAEIVVAQGATVTWTVTKSIGEPHTVTSGKPADADKGAAFDSATGDADLTTLMDVGGAFSVTFDAAGVYDYFCTIHSGMAGQVVVLAEGQSPPGEAHEGVPIENKLIGGGILLATLVVLFGAAWYYRRMNPA